MTPNLMAFHSYEEGDGGRGRHRSVRATMKGAGRLTPDKTFTWRRRYVQGEDYSSGTRCRCDAKRVRPPAGAGVQQGNQPARRCIPRAPTEGTRALGAVP